MVYVCYQPDSVCDKIRLSLFMPIIMQHFITNFTAINQHQPWLLPFLDIHQALTQDLYSLSQSSLASWLNGHFSKHRIAIKKHPDGTPLCFTTQDDLPHGMAYERFIYQQHKIPTRNNLHDWFGACVWSVFPKTKALLNAKHIAHMNDDNTRNRLRDTITVFDENGAILVISNEKIGHHIACALTNFDWQQCLIDHRPYWHNPNSPKDSDKAKIFIFGHALLEQLITPRKPLCSHTLIVSVPPLFFGLTKDKQHTFLDDCLSHRLEQLLQDGVTPKQLNPLPILGVPHFWQENQQPQFYQDTFVFRKGRKQTT